MTGRSTDNLAPTKLDPRKTALVTIDLQNGLIALPLRPHAASDIVANNAAIGHKLRAGGGLVIAVRIGFAPDYADRPQGLTDFPMVLPAGGLPSGWSDPAPGLADLPPDLVIIKKQWSAFFGTDLDLQLRRRGIETILLGGIATNFGVESTARDAWQANYNVIVIGDGCSSLADGLHDFARQNTLPRVARVRDTKDLLTML